VFYNFVSIARGLALALPHLYENKITVSGALRSSKRIGP
jgi:hypothetical protein